MISANILSSSLTYTNMPFKTTALVTISSSLPPMSWFVNTDFYWNFVLLTYYCIDTLLFYCFKCISFHRFVANCYHMSCLWLLTLHVIPIGAVLIAFLPRIKCSGPLHTFLQWVGGWCSVTWLRHGPLLQPMWPEAQPLWRTSIVIQKRTLKGDEPRGQMGNNVE